MVFKAQESRDIEVTIASVQTKKSEDKVKLYVYDSKGGEKICDTLLFKIKYEGPLAIWFIFN